MINISGVASATTLTIANTSPAGLSDLGRAYGGSSGGTPDTHVNNTPVYAWNTNSLDDASPFFPHPKHKTLGVARTRAFEHSTGSVQDAFVNGARAAGISGSGPAIAVFAPAVNTQSIEQLKKWYSRSGDVELIETKIINAELVSMEE